MDNSRVFSTRFQSNCFAAQTDPRFDQAGEVLVNPDVGGVVVAISYIVINMALPILLQWGTRDEDTVTVVIIMLVSHVYPILLATAASMAQGAKNDLSLFDAHFALAVSASPVSVYFAYSAFRDLFGYPNRLFQRLHKHRTVFRWLGVVLPFLWLAVNINISFNPSAFRNSKEYCGNITFVQWLDFQIASTFMAILDVMGARDIWNDVKGRGGLGAMCLVALWIWAVYLVRHMEDIIGVYQWRRSGARGGRGVPD